MKWPKLPLFLLKLRSFALLLTSSPCLLHLLLPRQTLRLLHLLHRHDLCPEIFWLIQKRPVNAVNRLEITLNNPTKESKIRIIEIIKDQRSEEKKDLKNVVCLCAKEQVFVDQSCEIERLCEVEDSKERRLVEARRVREIAHPTAVLLFFFVFFFFER